MGRAATVPSFAGEGRRIASATQSPPAVPQNSLRTLKPQPATSLRTAADTPSASLNLMLLSHGRNRPGSPPAPADRGRGLNPTPGGHHHGPTTRRPGTRPNPAAVKPVTERRPGNEGIPVPGPQARHSAPPPAPPRPHPTQRRPQSRPGPGRPVLRLINLHRTAAPFRPARLHPRVPGPDAAGPGQGLPTPPGHRRSRGHRLRELRPAGAAQTDILRPQVDGNPLAHAILSAHNV